MGRGGVVLYGDVASLHAAVRWGWPSRAWIARSGVRAPGLTSDGSKDFYGFRYVRKRTGWYGHNVIYVTTRGIGFPWPYLLAFPLAALLQRRVAKKKVGPPQI